MFSSPLIQNFCARRPLRASSLIVTIFGDSIALRGGTVWLGSLIKVLDRVGVAERLVRTNVFRLIQEDILISEKNGRRSFYSLSKAGRRDFKEASSQIYATTQTDWNGQLTLLMLAELSREEKSKFTKALKPLGFRGLTLNVWGAPTTNSKELEPLLSAFEISSKVVVLDASIRTTASLAPLQNMIATSWGLNALRNDYLVFNNLLISILKSLKSSPKIEREDAFFLRTFIIHEYRKLVLRDPDLPKPLLPQNWPGQTASKITAELYQLVIEDSELFIDEQFISNQGMLPRPEADFFNRFGGLRLKRTIE